MEVSAWLLKGFAFTALLAASSSADCSSTAGSCRDETSLLQVKKAVKLGLERSEDGQKAHAAQDPGKPWVMGNVGMPGAPASQPLMVELPGGGLGWVAPNDMRVVNAAPGADGRMYQPQMAQSVLAAQATPQNFVPGNAAFVALPPNIPPAGYGVIPQGSGYGAGMPGRGPDPLAMQAPDQMFEAGMPRSEEQRELEPQVVLPGDAQRARNTQHELASLQGLGMPQIGFGPDGLARLEVPGGDPQGRKAGAVPQFQAPDQDQLASLGISGAVPQGTGAMLAPELGRLGLPQGAARADVQPPGVSGQMQPGMQDQYMLPWANAGSLPQGAMPGSVMMGMPPGMQPFAMDGLGNAAVHASGMMPQFPQDVPAQFQIDPSMVAPAAHPAMPRVEQQASQTDKAAELTDKMASETEEVVDKAVARAMEVLKAKKQEAALAEAKMNEASKAQKKMLAEKAKKAAVTVGSKTRMEMASEEQQFAENAAKQNAAAENRQRAVAKQAAEKAAAEKVASAAQKAVAKSAARTAAAEQAAAAAEKVVADLGPA